ncbi:MAG: hypothetical protein N3A38_10185 [Planctomycetota bacterium]|nr:hypothetical protein [Planctomycetota bacterium]
MQIIYCDRCGRRMTDSDIHEGRAVLLNGKAFCFDCSPSGAQERAADQACRRKESASSRLQNPLGRIAHNTPVGTPAVTERRKSSRRLPPQPPLAGTFQPASGAASGGTPPAAAASAAITPGGSHPTGATSAGAAPGRSAGGVPEGAAGAPGAGSIGRGTPEAGPAPGRRSSVRLVATKAETGPPAAQIRAAGRISARQKVPSTRRASAIGIAWLIAVSAAVALAIVLIIALALRTARPSPSKQKAVPPHGRSLPP